MMSRCSFDKKSLERTLRKRGLREDLIHSILMEYPDDYRCAREAYKDGMCAFHSEEKPENFEELFWDELEKGVRSEEVEEIDFTGAIFPSMVFRRAGGSPLKVNKPILFTGAKFEKADFSYAKFFEAVFFGARFEDGVFAGTEFTFAYFMGAKFRRGNFGGANFHEEANFEEADFREAVFSNARFEAESMGARFIKAKFRKADFMFSEFRTWTFFEGAEFEEANFSRAKFYKAYFRDAKFKKVSFSGAEFEEADFSKAKLEEASFSWTRFHGNANLGFNLTGLADFSGAVFDGYVLLIPEQKQEGILTFFMTVFKDPKKVFITGFPLSSISFLYTDISYVTLAPAGSSGGILDEKLWRYKEEERKERRGKERSINIDRNTSKKPPWRKPLTPLTEWERKVYERLEPHLNRELIVAEYKAIRKCLESNRMFTEASDLFIREMRISRERLGIKQLPEKIAHYLYDWIAGYGESVGRPVLWAFLTVLLSALYFEAMQGSLFTTLSALLTALMQGNLLKFLNTLGKPLLMSISVFLQMKSLRDFNVGMSSDVLLLEIVVRILSILIIGSLFISLRRKLERR